MSRLDAIHLLLAHLRERGEDEYEALAPQVLAALGYGEFSDAFEVPGDVPVRLRTLQMRNVRSADRPNESEQPKLHLDTLPYH